LAALEAFDLQARDILGERLKMTPVKTNPAFRKIIPVRALGLVRFETEVYRSERLESISLMKAGLFGLVRIFNIVLRPNPRFNLPLLSSDVMFTGSRRAFYIEVIDPAGLDDGNKAAGFRRMLDLKRQTAGFEQRTAFSGWYGRVLADCTVMTRTTRRNDALMLRIHGEFLRAYLAMTEGAQPLDETVSRRVGDSILGFVNRLTGEGGSSVKLFRRLVGPEKGRDFVRSMVFGIQENPSRPAP
jgi:hypothetical protein